MEITMKKPTFDLTRVNTKGRTLRFSGDIDFVRPATELTEADLWHAFATDRAFMAIGKSYHDLRENYTLRLATALRLRVCSLLRGSPRPLRKTCAERAQADRLRDIGARFAVGRGHHGVV
jgi:hypothetical protein